MGVARGDKELDPCDGAERRLRGAEVVEGAFPCLDGGEKSGDLDSLLAQKAGLLEGGRVRPAGWAVGRNRGRRWGLRRETRLQGPTADLTPSEMRGHTPPPGRRQSPADVEGEIVGGDVAAQSSLR